jgi:acylphosphatase
MGASGFVAQRQHEFAHREYYVMAEKITLVRRVIVEGLVQGVGYRDFARRAALRLGISGWVRNRADGTVEALIAGAPAEVEAMLAELRRGPRGAEVTGLKLLDSGDVEDTGTETFVVRSNF